METYTAKKQLVNNPDFQKQRMISLGKLDYNDIDKPLVDLIRNMSRLPYCFTLQCCFGHFVHDRQPDIYDVAPLMAIDGPMDVEYRIAYIALCIDNIESGRRLLSALEALVEIDKEYIQFGCADWFWERQINSYVPQVQPERHKTLDKMTVDIQEAYHIEKIRNRFFSALGEIVDNHTGRMA